MVDVSQTDFIHAAEDGFPLSMRLTSAENPSFAILLSAGTGYPKNFYDRFAKWMAARGATVLTYDYRGIGGSKPKTLYRSTIDLPQWGRLDAPAALEALIEAAPGLSITHVAHSVGGHLLGLMPNHDQIKQHIFVSVGTGWWGGHLKSYRTKALGFWHLIGPWSLYRHGYIKGSLWGGTDLPPRVYRTWRRWSRTRAYFSGELQTTLKPHAYDKVSGRVRSYLFTDDPIATYQSAMDLMCVYPKTAYDFVIRSPQDYKLKRLGHDGAFRSGTEDLWQEFLDWLKPSPRESSLLC